MPAHRFISVVSCLVILSANCVLAQNPPVPKAPVSPAFAAELRVKEFALQLERLPMSERAQPLRDFFGSLKDSETKIEAMRRFYSPYILRVAPIEMVDELVGPFLRDPDPKVRLQALSALDGTPRASGAPAVFTQELEELLRSSDPKTRGLALLAMGAAHHPRYRAAVLEHLNDPDPVIRSTAVQLAGGGPGSLPRLRKLLKDPSPGVRAMALRFVPVAEATRLLADPESGVREAALERLGHVGALSDAPKAARMIGDPDYMVRAKAVEALGNLRHHGYRDRIIRVLEHDRNVVPRRYAVDALSRLDDVNALPALQRALRQEDELVRKDAARAIDMLTYRWEVSASPPLPPRMLRSPRRR